jgi:hypothetical protein
MIQYLAGNSNISYGIDSLSLCLFGPGTKSEDCYTIATSSASDDSLSLLYTTLPQALQSRVPKLRSLRSVASVYTTRKSQPHTRNPSASSASSSCSESPPPSYHTRTSISDDEDDDDEDDDDEDDDDEDDDDASDVGSPASFNTAPSSRPSTSGSATPAPPHLQTFFPPQDQDQSSTNTGIGNKSGYHGLALLNLALRSEQTSSTPNDPVDRRFYIDGVSYILRGLPKDLTPEETLVLRTATPQTLLPPPENQDQQLASPSTPPTNTQPTLLHTLTSTLTYHLILLSTLLLPYLQSLLTALLAFDAQHQLSARFCAQTKILLNNLFSFFLECVLRVWEANDGALRISCRDFGIWVLTDFCGGLEEGVGRAAILGVVRREGGMGK